MIKNNRIFGLDILRCCAIIFVVIGHGKYLLSPQLSKISGYIFGYDGVSIFFVLSGFLIGGILIKTIDKNKTINRTTLFQFWTRRWFRTLPNYFLILVLLCVLSFVFTDDFSLWHIRKYFIFAQNLYKPHPEFFPEAWSLCIEEWFYLLIPLLIAVFIRCFTLSPKKSVAISAITVILVVTFFRYYKFLHTNVTDVWEVDLFFRKQVVTRLDSLMFGVIGAYLNYYYYDKWIKHKNIFLIAGIFLFLLTKLLRTNFISVSQTGLYNSVFSFSILSIATLMLLPFLNDLKSGKGVVYKIITRISLISYSMYLLNLSVIQLNILNKIDWSDIFDNRYAIMFSKYTLYWTLVIVLSNLLYKYWEVPMMKWRDNRRIKKMFRI